MQAPYHDFDSHNPYAHVMLTMRSVEDSGFGKKQRDWNKRALENSYNIDRSVLQRYLLWEPPPY